MKKFELLNGQILYPKDVEKILSVGEIKKNVGEEFYFRVDLPSIVFTIYGNEKLFINRNEFLSWIDDVNRLKESFRFCDSSMVTRNAEIENVSKLYSHEFYYKVRGITHKIEFDDQAVLERNYEDFKNWTDFGSYL